jgi:hypothetical protein
MEKENTELEKKEYLKKIIAQIDDELSQAKSHAKWYKENATKNKRRYMALRIPVIVFGIVLPILVMAQKSGQSQSLLSTTTIVISLIISILTSLDTFFQYGKSWAEERSAELALYSLLRKYKREKIKIEQPGSLGNAITVAEQTMDSLQEEYEQIVSRTVDTFMKRAKEIESTRPLNTN